VSEIPLPNIVVVKISVCAPNGDELWTFNSLETAPGNSITVEIPKSIQVDEIDKILFAYQLWAVDGQGHDIRLPGKRLTHAEAKQAIEALLASEREKAERLKEQDTLLRILFLTNEGTGAKKYVEDRLATLNKENK